MVKYEYFDAGKAIVIVRVCSPRGQEPAPPMWHCSLRWRNRWHECTGFLECLQFCSCQLLDEK